MTAPTSTRGYVDPYRLGNDSYASLYLDVLEHVPDLSFPMSVPVYSKMRRDPKLSSITQGWVLNLLRAQWQLDPAGCRPEVVAAVADGLGLPIKGTDDKPGAARLRGVSWGDHLRAVFRMVPFGFSAFELEAEIADGRARLAGLWERPQWTISHIHTDGKTGLLTGATQDQAADLKSPQMPAKNLAWYARDREGSNWAGTSLLRPSYASWLIKEEVRRAFAVANVRWSAGVPVLEALPGTNPTQAQMGEAAEVAQAARAGISAGAATPPGFVMKILGITGSLPPTQEFLRWLDQQCASSALMNAFELGETPNGSRALGSVFVDALLLALEAEAEFVADVATRQIAARIVDWNWGEGEPVPRVVVSGVGSRREVTADALKLLLDSGGLAADPALEAWIRREWRLPERDGMAQPKATAPGVDLPERPAELPAGRKPRGRQRRTPGQMALFNAADPEPDHAAIQEQWEQAKADLLNGWRKTAKPMVDELADQAEEAAASGDLAQFASLAVSAGVIATLSLPLGDKGSKVAKQAAAQVIAEAAAQDVDIDAPDEPGAERARQTADVVASLIASGYAAGAKRAALLNAGANPAEVRDAVRSHLDELADSSNGLVGDHIGGLLSAAQNAGRIAVLEQTPARRYRAVEVNDTNRCEACADVDGTEFPTLAKAVAAYPIAGFGECAGGMRCRGFLFPLFM
ncbi:DUF935 family protein [Actinoplanes sp. NPDC023936]|uniref:phage portal protein family protein n=1 Tax=Actinoplanes sp. NPDC023936 TaxID=3154910 RepID=UPI0033EAA726